MAFKGCGTRVQGLGVGVWALQKGCLHWILWETYRATLAIVGARVGNTLTNNPTEAQPHPPKL